jgi:hypothetical protein
MVKKATAYGQQAVCQVKPKNAVSLFLICDAMRAEVSSQFLISSLLSFKLDYKKKGESAAADGRRTDGRRLALFFTMQRLFHIPSHQYNVFFGERNGGARAVNFWPCIYVFSLSLSSRKAIIIIG